MATYDAEYLSHLVRTLRYPIKEIGELTGRDPTAFAA
jgi:hypothetical protein